MITKVEQLCPVCDSDKQELKFEPWVDENDPAKLYGAASGIPGTQRVVTCLKCGMIFESPRYDANTIVQGYMASHEADHDSQYHMRVYSFFRTLVKHASHLPLPGARVLDIGTAGGAFLDAAKQYGYDAYGMEPSSDLVARGKARGLKIEQGTIERHDFEGGSFDMICLWDVIEHLPNPKAALVEIKKLLKPNGILLINYPDIGTWQAKLAGTCTTLVASRFPRFAGVPGLRFSIFKGIGKP
jgi:2-polyprenyl-3-methyl-5-hydroxy-6-metoxy-1,4-benzoquinol methylase